MGLFDWPKKEPEPLLRLVVEFADPDDEDAEVTPLRSACGQYWVMGAAHLVCAERVDGLVELLKHPANYTAAAWAQSYWDDCGFDMLEDELDGLGFDWTNAERIVVLGRMWSHSYHTTDGEDHDAGFAVEAVEEVIVR